MPKKKIKKIAPSEFVQSNVVLSQIRKHVSYIGFADRRAQGLITVNAFLIPIALSGINRSDLQLGVVIVIMTALLSVLTCILALYPRRYRHDDVLHNDLFHFVEIDSMTEEEFVSTMAKSLKDFDSLITDTSRDLYHVAKLIVAPKYRWLKTSYFIFAIGNFIAIVTIFFQIFQLI